MPSTQVVLISGGDRLRAHERLPFPVTKHASPQRCRNALSDLVLNRKYVIEGAIEALGPSVVSRSHVDQLDADPEPVVGLANAPFEEGSDTESLADGANVAAGLPELKRCRARDHAQTIYVCERVDQLLGETLAEIVLVAAGAHVGKRQHRDSGRIVRARRDIGFTVGCLRGDPGNELVAAPMARLDEAGLFRIVGQRAPQFLDARRERVVADSRIAPDRREQVLFGHRLPCVRDEHLQHRRRLRGKTNLACAGPEPARPHVEPIAAETDVLLQLPFLPAVRRAIRIPAKSRRSPGTWDRRVPYVSDTSNRWRQ